MGSSLAWQTNSQLHDAVRGQLHFEPEINTSDVAILVADGVVTLTGFVNSDREKSAVESAAKCVRGVRAVANDVHVKLRDERSDPDIARDAAHMLQNHAGVPSSVTVTVRDGLVTLEGTVEWNYQRSAAESAVSHLNGVKDVSNSIQVCPAATPNQVKTLIEKLLVSQ